MASRALRPQTVETMPLDCAELEQRVLMSATPLGGEIAVNAESLDIQEAPAVAMDADGDFVVAWESQGQDGDGWGIYAQRFDRDGTPQDAEFQVNTNTAGDQRDADVAIDADGDFVITYSGSDANDADGIFAQRYNSAGDAQGGEFRVNTTSSGVQRSAAIAMDADGDFVIAWDGEGPGDADGVFAQRFNADGVAQGGEFRVNETILGQQQNADVATDAGGNFVVAWNSTAAGSNSEIFAQRFDAAGKPLGGELSVSNSANTLTDPALAISSGGDFVVTWSADGQDGDGWGIFAQQFDAAGVAQGGQFQVNTEVNSDQFNSDVAMDAAGNFVVSWASDGQDGDGWGIYARAFQADGTADGGEFLVSTSTLGDQAVPAIGMADNGEFTVVWDGQGVGDADGVFAQPFHNAAFQAVADLVVHYELDDGGGNAVLDATGNTRDGILLNGGAWTGGRSGGGLQFDGVDDVVEDIDAENYLNGLSEITVALWVKSDTTGTDAGFVSGVIPDGRDEVLSFRYDANGVNSGGTDLIKIGLNTTDGFMQLESSSNVQSTEWQHLAFTWTAGGQLQLYVNGQLDTPADVYPAKGGTIAGIDRLLVGQGSKVPASWNGLLDDVRIYDRALAEAEIATIISQGNQAPTAAADSYNVVEDTALNVAAGGLTANDSDLNGDLLGTLLVSGPANGALTLNGDGSFDYTPDPGFVGTDSFVYKVSDGFAESGAATATITVTGTPPPPPPSPDPIQPIAPPPPVPDDGGGDSGVEPEQPDPGESELDPAEPDVPDRDDENEQPPDDSAQEQEPPTVTPMPNVVPEPAAAQTSDGSPAASSDRAGADASPGSEARTREWLAQSVAEEGDSEHIQSRGDARATQQLDESGDVSNAMNSRNATAAMIANLAKDDSEEAALAVELAALSEELQQQQAAGPSFSVAAAAGCTVAMSAGYVMWSMRGSYLVASFLASTPTWKLIDPLPILQFDHAGGTLTVPPSQTLWTREGDRVESMFDNVKATAEDGAGRNNSSISGQPQRGTA